MNSEQKVVVAMSGGVDSSVAALLLKEQGVCAIGVSMQVWDYRNNGGCNSKATCCSPDDFTDARRVAGLIGIPYYVFDLEETFKEKVIDNFIDKYQHGLTPNPCVECNNKVKFKELRKRSGSVGCQTVATGHYARIEKSENGHKLLRGKDLDKDQSYFLYGLKQSELKDTLFPVGSMLKSEVREAARSFELLTADKAESQDICFVSGSLRDFMKKHGKEGLAGDIVDKDGNVLGSHDGIQQYTVGQRRGLGVGGKDQPIYVTELDYKNNRVVVGNRSDLEVESFEVGELNWVSPKFQEDKARKEFNAIAQLRHRHAGVKVRASYLPSGNLRLEFIDEWSTVAPGQAAVLYDMDNREVLVGGKILGRREAGMLGIWTEARTRNLD